MLTIHGTPSHLCGVSMPTSEVCKALESTRRKRKEMEGVAITFSLFSEFCSGTQSSLSVHRGRRVCPLGERAESALWEKEQFREKLGEKSLLIREHCGGNNVGRKIINGSVKNIRCLDLLVPATQKIKCEFLFSGEINNWERKSSEAQLAELLLEGL